MGGLGVEDGIQRELGQARLDVSRGSGSIARDDVSPVPLAVDEQVFLSQLYERITYTGITVWVVLHSLTNDVRHLVELAVVHAFHGMEDATLNRFQSIVDAGDSPLQYHVRGIVKKPVLIHAGQVVLDGVVERTYRLRVIIAVRVVRRHRINRRRNLLLCICLLVVCHNRCVCYSTVLLIKI